MQITLREATATDAPLLANLCLTIHRLHVAAVPHVFKPIEPNNADLINFYIEQFQEGSFAYIAEVDNQAAGYFFGKIATRPENVFTYPLTRLVIDQMGVEEAYRKQGIGKVLMDKAFALAREADLQQVTLSVWAFNAGAKAFYDATGFEVAYHTMSVNLERE